jgi:hypothetical protein
LRGSGGAHVGAGCRDVAKGSGRGVRFVSSQELRCEAWVVAEPAVVDSVVECSVGRRSKRSRDVKSEFSILFMTNHNVGGRCRDGGAEERNAILGRESVWCRR